MKANRQRLLTTISVVVDCWDRAKTHKDFAEQVGAHIEDLRDILHAEKAERTRHRQNRESHRARIESLHNAGQSIVQEFRTGARKCPDCGVVGAHSDTCFLWEPADSGTSANQEKANQ